MCKKYIYRRIKNIKHISKYNKIHTKEKNNKPWILHVYENFTKIKYL